METVDHIAQAHRHADVDDLLGVEVSRECPIRGVVDRLEPGRLARIDDDRSLGRLVDALGERLRQQMLQFLF